MLLSTPGMVLHTTPYAETSVVAKVFTRQLGVQSYLVKGVRSRNGRMKQNLFNPLCSLDMVVYDTRHGELNYIKELSPRHPAQPSDPVGNALRFFMTEVLYKVLRESEPMPELWDYVETESEKWKEESCRDVPIRFLLTVARHLGIEPMDNYSSGEPLFDLQEGRFVSLATETTLSEPLSAMLHEYLCNNSEGRRINISTLSNRRSLLDALLAYYQLHLSGFRNFRSHDILHTILR